MSEAERELREEIMHDFQVVPTVEALRLQILAWHEKHSPRVPSRAELIEKIIYWDEHTRRKTDQLADQILALMHPKPEWCEHCKWYGNRWGFREPDGVMISAGRHWTCCPICKKDRPQ